MIILTFVFSRGFLYPARFLVYHPWHNYSDFSLKLRHNLSGCPHNSKHAYHVVYRVNIKTQRNIKDVGLCSTYNPILYHTNNWNNIKEALCTRNGCINLHAEFCDSDVNKGCISCYEKARGRGLLTAFLSNHAPSIKVSHRNTNWSSRKRETNQ